MEKSIENGGDWIDELTQAARTCECECECGGGIGDGGVW